jgi:hypothetical protein
MGSIPEQDYDGHAEPAKYPTLEPPLMILAAIPSPVSTTMTVIKMQSPDPDAAPPLSTVKIPPILQHTAAQSAHLSKSALQVPRGPSSMHALAYFLETFNEVQKAENDINNIKSDISKAEGEYGQRRIATINHIDVEVANRHREKRHELRAKQCKEMEDLRAGHTEEHHGLWNMQRKEM